MKKNKLILIPILILVSCTTGNKVSQPNGKLMESTSASIQTQANADHQETEQIKTPTLDKNMAPQPSAANISEATENTTERLFGEMVAVAVEFPNQAIVAFDFESGESRRLRQDGSFVFLDWVDKGCELIIGETTSDVGSIYKIDLQGDFVEEVTYYDFQTFEGYIGLGVSDIYWSASGEYIAYLVSAYEDSTLRDPNLFNLYISKVDDPDSAIVISQNDGVFDAAWSLDGSIIAFTDYDDTGILQLYVSAPEKTEKHELTNFSLNNSTIQHISWSPDNKYIAFNYVARKEDSGRIENKLVFVSFADFEQLEKSINSIDGKEFEEVQNIWWVDENVLVADVIHSVTDKYSSGIYWINSHSDMVVDMVLQEDVGPLSGPWSQSVLSGNYFGLRVWPEFWVYDLETREVIGKTQMPVDLASSWYLVPHDFPGEANCN